MIPGSIAIRRLGLLRNDALGDTLLTLPVATAVKQYEPLIEVELICQEAYQPLLKGHPDLDAVHADPGGSSRALARLLRARKYDALLVLRPTPRNARAAWLARVPVRVGTAWRAYGMLFNVRWFGHRKLNQLHEVECNLHLLARLIGPVVSTTQLYLPPPAAYEEAAGAILQEAGVTSDRPLVAIHPGSRVRPDGHRSALPWPTVHFATLAGLLVKRGYQVIITGSAEESGVTGEVAAVDGTIDLTARTHLGELAWLLKSCDTLIANSTGVLHLGAAVGTSVIGIYPASQSMSPVRWGPFGRGHKVFRGPAEVCNRRKCTWEECAEFNCLQKILPEEVFKVADRFVAQSPFTLRRDESISAESGPG
ncbi:glycosyltransferase family 9 protein [Gemmatimonadota bacterium]